MQRDPASHHSVILQFCSWALLAGQRPHVPIASLASNLTELVSKQGRACRFETMAQKLQISLEHWLTRLSDNNKRKAPWQVLLCQP